MPADTVKVLQLSQFKAYLASRGRDSHKGMFGPVLIIGGDKGYSGAVRLAGEAALRVGAGLVFVATHPQHAAWLNATRPELICHGVTSAQQIKPWLAEAAAIVLGPGLGQSAWSKGLWKATLATSKPLVLDADGLNLLAKAKPLRKSQWVLTPHPGEAARLLKCTTTEIQQDRQGALHALQDRWGGVTVLKGAGTLIAAAGYPTAICKHGNPGMATAGMGDVLSGIIGGLLAQALPAVIAAKLGVLVHALSGDHAAAQGGERGLIASDLLPLLRPYVNLT